MKKTIFILALFLCSFYSSAVNMDSLWNIWIDSSQSDNDRYHAFNKIILNCLETNPDSALILAKKFYEKAESIDEKMWMGRALIREGVALKILNKQESAIEAWKKALINFEFIGDREHMNNAYTKIAQTSSDIGDYQTAIEYNRKSINIAKVSGDKKEMFWKSMELSQCFQVLGDFDKSLNLILEAIEIALEINLKPGLVRGYMTLGLIHSEQGNSEKAMEYYNKSLKIAEESGDKRGKITLYCNIGNIYYMENNYEKALDYYNRGLKISEEINYTRTGSIHNSIGRIYLKQDNNEMAMQYFKINLMIAEETNDKRGLFSAYNNFGDAYFIQAKYTKALFFGEKALGLAQEIGGVKEIVLSSKLLFNAYKKTNQPNKALEMYELYIQMRDSIINEENTKALVQQEYKYQYEKEQAVAEAKYLKELALSEEREKRQKVISYGAVTGMAMVLIFAFLIYNRFKLTKKQKEVIQEKNKHITESITYARRIQEASLTTQDYLGKILNEYFILYQPKDIVSGDFYWAHEIDKDLIMVAVCDCTGHGVPGAFMSMISTSLLNEIVIENGVTRVDHVLDNLRSHIIKALKQDKENSESMDGLDMTLLLIDKEKKTIQFASAGHTLYLARKGEVIEEKGNPFPVGFLFGREIPFSSKEIELQKGDMLYMTSDGFTEQFGGKENKMYGYRKFRKLIIDCSHQPMEQQKKQFYRSFKNWRGSQKQIDDICVMGLRF